MLIYFKSLRPQTADVDENTIKMRRIKLNLKVVRLLLLLYMVMSLSMLTMAQNQTSNGGLFGWGPVSNDMEYSNRGGLFDPTSVGGYNLFNQQFGSDVIGGYELYNQTFGQNVPLGSGLLTH